MDPMTINYNFAKAEDIQTEVNVSNVKETLVEKTKHLSEEEKALVDQWDKEYQKQGIHKDSLHQMGFAAALGKDERKFALQTLIEQGRVRTVSSGANTLGVSVPTIRKYLRELKLSIWDDERAQYFYTNHPDEVRYDVLTGERT